MKPTIITAAWCGPCRVLKTTLTTLNLIDKVEFKDANEDASFTKSHGVRSVPTLLVLSENEVLKYTGLEDIISILKEL